MLRFFVFLYAAVFLVLGITGFLPNIAVGDQLFVIFRVNFWLNLINTIAGVWAFFALFMRRSAIRFYFQIFGLFFGLLAVLGFVYKGELIFGAIANGQVNTWFHVIVAVLALILGFGSQTGARDERTKR